MVRDGRDVVASYVSSLGEEKNITVRDASHRWCDSLLMIRRRIENEPEGFFLEIRYEDLVRSHNEITTKIMQFLNLTKKNGGFLLGNNDDTNMLHHQNLNLSVSGRSIGGFKSKLSNKEKTQMMKIIKPYLHMYNYE